MRTIINATNLLGDSLYTLQPIKQYLDGMGDAPVTIVADKGLAFQMFQDTFPHSSLYDNIDSAINSGKMGEDIILIDLNSGNAGHICFTKFSQTGKQPHISEGYAEMLGIKLNSPIIPYAPWNNWEPNLSPPPIRIGISPFSKSCSRHTGEVPNKTLDDWKWNPIQTYLRLHCDELTVFGGPKDILTNCPISEDERFVASSFEDLRKKLKSMTLFITVDNGLGHIASVLNVPTVIIWPKVSSMDFIAPKWAPNTYYLMNVDPNRVTPAELLTGLRQFVQKEWNK